MTFRKTAAALCRRLAETLDPQSGLGLDAIDAAAARTRPPECDAVPAAEAIASPTGPGPQVRIAHEMLVRSYLERALRPNKPPETFVS